MTDWIEHDGGPQPVANDVWVESLELETDIDPEDNPMGYLDYEFMIAGDMLWGSPVRYRILNQHVIDEARLEGIRLGLRAAAEVSDAVWQMGVRPGATILSLKPETIAKETAR
jgi:hypothetical protein